MTRIPENWVFCILTYFDTLERSEAQLMFRGSVTLEMAVSRQSRTLRQSPQLLQLLPLHHQCWQDCMLRGSSLTVFLSTVVVTFI